LLLGEGKMKRFIVNVLISGSILFALPSHAVTNMSLSDNPLFLGGFVAPNIMLTLDDSYSMSSGVIRQDDVEGEITPEMQGSIHFNALAYDPDTTYEPWMEFNGTRMANADKKKHGTNGYYYQYNEKKGALKWKKASNKQNYANWKVFHSTRILQAQAGVGEAFADQSDDMRVGFAKTSLSSKQEPNIYYPGATVDDKKNTYAVVSGVRTFSNNNRASFYDSLYDAGTPPAKEVTSSGEKPSPVGKGTLGEHTPLRQTAHDIKNYFSRTDNKGPWGKTPGTDNTAPQLSCRKNINIMVSDGQWNADSIEIGNVDAVSGLTHANPKGGSYTYTPESPFKDSYANTLADNTMKIWDTDLRSDLTDNVPATAEDPAFWQHLTTITVGLDHSGSLAHPDDLEDLEDGTKTWPNPTTAFPPYYTNSKATYQEKMEAYNTALQYKVDDFWHAGLNGRGGYFNATEPSELADQIASILSSIKEDNLLSYTSLAFNGLNASTVSKVYRASFNSDDWSGQLEAHAIEQQSTSNGSRLVITGLAWNAEDELPKHNDRKIITYKRVGDYKYKAIPFRWDNISGFQQNRLEKKVKHLNYLRGDRSLEQHNGGPLRDRETILGDIINASPVYVGGSQQNFPDTWDNDASATAAENNEAYSSFKSGNAARQGMVYVGANDGMLHAFNADTGEEVFAYVPNSVIKERLVNLTKPNYDHKYYVDGDIVVSDAFFDGEWHTVLVSGLGGGGQGVFAIDITSVPSSSDSETTIAEKVLWEFHDNFDAKDNNGGDNGRSDLGYTYGKPSIVRLNSGKWGVVFSGGYNNTVDDDFHHDTNPDKGRFDSDTGNAVLYIVDIETGALIKKFDTQTGFIDDPSVEAGKSNGRPNGLASPTLVDLNNDFKADVIYAGDLFGNVWKIDISDNIATSSWGFSAGSISNPEPIYTACADANCVRGSSNNHQPITSQIQVVPHPTKVGNLLLLGTGKYLETIDTATEDQITQSFYAIEDLGTSTSFNRSSLLEQTISDSSTSSGKEVRTTSQNTIDWATHHGWYLDFSTDDDNNGERQISEARVLNNSVVFNTFTPSEDQCSGGGSNWLMLLELYSGARFDLPSFDLNNDGVYTVSDNVNIGSENSSVSGINTGSGNPAGPSVIGDGSGGLISVGNDSSGNSDANISMQPGGNNAGNTTEDDYVPIGRPATTGRQSWRQLDTGY